jgi:hypothetical protein
MEKVAMDLFERPQDTIDSIGEIDSIGTIGEIDSIGEIGTIDSIRTILP